MISRIEQPADSAVISRNRLFAGIPSEILTEIGSDMALLRFERDDVVFHEGEHGDCLYLVCEGSVRISKVGRGGKQETLGYIQPGNFFGEMALIDGQPRSAQATATETTVLGRVDQAAFERILERAPRDLHMNFLRSVVERLRGVNAHYITELMRQERLSLVGSMANSIIHDLKNPIQCIRSCTELLARKVPDTSLSDFFSIMNRATDRMVDMTQELLDFARGRTSIQLARRRVDDVVTELDGQLASLIPKEIHYMREIETPAAELLVDVGRFARMLLNLIKNAVEAMPQGGVLWLRARQQEGTVVFRVSDTGCGIDPELQARIFEPFVTYGKSKGTGLGMAIVKSVVEAHRGTISISSKIGVGTSIEVCIPAAALDGAAAGAPTGLVRSLI